MIVSDEYFVNFIDGTLNSDRKIRIISQGESDILFIRCFL